MCFNKRYPPRRVPCFVHKVGSGSTFAYGVLDTGYSYDLTVEEAHARALKYATITVG